MIKDKLLRVRKKTLHISKSSLWFFIGFTVSGLTLLSIVVIYFQNTYSEKVIPGVFINDTYVGEMTKEEIVYLYEEKNKNIGDSSFTFTYEDVIATISAQDLDIGYNSELISDQAVGMGKSSNILSNFFIITNAYLNGISLNSSYTFKEDRLKEELKPFKQLAYKEPVNAKFTVENNKVVEFSQSENGTVLDEERIEKFVYDRIPIIISSSENTNFEYLLPTITLEPEITTEEVNEYGIEEKIGEGVSYFVGSIPNRIYNIGLAASRIDGTLVAPGEEFSFNKNIGDISKLSGYKEAYVISNGRTILGDGGGVCQVSTTLFRAMLDAGVPITERHAHSYRVGYYEQQSPVGIDATIYVPSVDLKFKNDTGKHILISADFDPVNQKLVFSLFGKSDGRVAVVSDPVILSQSGAPEPLYEDDPELPVGVTKQVDFAASGANVQFTRTVTRNGEVLIDETYNSRYSPWRAVFKVGTKQG